MGTGKKTRGDLCTLPLKKHPRGDGEEVARTTTSSIAAETPPWGRGRNGIDRLYRVAGGNTPVGTGKKLGVSSGVRLERKHPRGDGEEAVADDDVADI